MYYPFFRGKQNELITIRENAHILKDSQFIPIIEPVKELLGGLIKALNALEKISGKGILIVNPLHGDYASNSEGIMELLNSPLQYQNITPGILLTKSTTIEAIENLCSFFSSRQVALIHAGFSEAKLLLERIPKVKTEMTNIFIEDCCGKLYQRHFKGSNRILIRDGFEKRANREHPETEFFSDLHITYEDEGMDGFGDFLIVGDDYKETGGPAYAVAIHLTFIDSSRDSEMLIHHFKSIRQHDPTDPAGKFSEALSKLVEELSRDSCQIFRSNAIKEFLDLHNRGHFPGLGYVKKLSMQHHIETLSNFISNNEQY